VQSELEERFERFFRYKYYKDILKAARYYPEIRSVVIDFDDLETFDYELAEQLLNNPNEILQMAERVLNRMSIIPSNKIQLNIRFKNIPNHTLVADLGRSTYISKFVSFEGIMVSISEIKQRCQVAAFECKSCGEVVHIEQEDGSDVLVEPAMCGYCHRKSSFRLLKEESIYKDVQLLKVQEHFEKAQGTQPRQVTVIVEDDLTQERVWGTHVKVSGILEIRHEKRRGRKTRDARKYVVANYVEFENEHSKALELHTRGDPRVQAACRGSQYSPGNNAQHRTAHHRHG